MTAPDLTRQLADLASRRAGGEPADALEARYLELIDQAREAVNNVPPASACRLYVTWGEAEEALGHHAAALRAYAEGLRLAQHAPDPEPIPAVGKYDIDGPDAEVEQVHQREMQQRAHVALQNELARCRELLIRKCADLVGSNPQLAPALSELGLAGQIVANIRGDQR